MRRHPLRGAGLMLTLIALIVLLNRCSGWWDDTFGPTSTGPQGVGTAHHGPPHAAATMGRVDLM